MSFKHRAPKSPRKQNSPEPHAPVAGRLVGHRDGYGFVIPDQPLPDTRGDIFIGAAAMGGALHGDRVLVSGLRVRSDGRAEGRIQRVLERAQNTVVGEFRFGHRANYVIPFDDRIPHQIVIPRGQEQPPGAAAQREALDGAVVNVEITRFPSGLQSGAGKVLEILGRPGEVWLPGSERIGARTCAGSGQEPPGVTRIVTNS